MSKKKKPSISKEDLKAYLSNVIGRKTLNFIELEGDTIKEKYESLIEIVFSKEPEKIFASPEIASMFIVSTLPFTPATQEEMLDNKDILYYGTLNNVAIYAVPSFKPDEFLLICKNKGIKLKLDSFF